MPSSNPWPPSSRPTKDQPFVSPTAAVIVAEAVALADNSACVASVHDRMVAPTGIPAPEMDRPSSASVIAPEANVIVASELTVVTETDLFIPKSALVVGMVAVIGAIKTSAPPQTAALAVLPDMLSPRWLEVGCARGSTAWGGQI